MQNQARQPLLSFKPMEAYGKTCNGEQCWGRLLTEAGPWGNTDCLVTGAQWWVRYSEPSWVSAGSAPCAKANTPGSNSWLKVQKGHQIFDIHSLGHSLLQMLLCVLLRMNSFFFGTVSSHNCVIFFFFSFWSSYLLIWCSNNDSVSERIARRRVIQFSYYTLGILKKHLN